MAGDKQPTLRVAERPGIAGTVGECVVCGKTFIVELLTGAGVQCVELAGFKRENGEPALVTLHERCLPALERGRDDGWQALTEGPLRRYYAELVEALQVEGDRDGGTL